MDLPDLSSDNFWLIAGMVLGALISVVSGLALSYFNHVLELRRMRIRAEEGRKAFEAKRIDDTVRYMMSKSEYADSEYTKSAGSHIQRRTIDEGWDSLIMPEPEPEPKKPRVVTFRPTDESPPDDQQPSPDTEEQTPE